MTFSEISAKVFGYLMQNLIDHECQRISHFRVVIYAWSIAPSSSLIRVNLGIWDWITIKQIRAFWNLVDRVDFEWVFQKTRMFHGHLLVVKLEGVGRGGTVNSILNDGKKNVKSIGNLFWSLLEKTSKYRNSKVDFTANCYLSFWF